MGSRSWAEQFDFKCPACHTPLSVKAWLLIDLQERPDLLKRIGSDTLNTLICPNCNNKTGLDLPLLLYRADGDPPLLFSPSRQIPRERESRQLAQLLSQLQKQPETTWVNDFTFGIQGVKRERLSGILGVDLKVILDELVESQRASDWERAVTLTARALELVTPEEDARMWMSLRKGWAAAHCELAAGYLEQVSGERASNVEKAIYHGRQALEVLTQENVPQLWALAHHNLAIAYINRIAEDHEKNLREAVLHHHEALKVYTFDAYPKDWALEQEGLANLYGEIYDQNRSRNLEEAIRLLTRTLDVHSATEMPREYIRTMNNLALAYGMRVEGDPVRNLERAREILQDALKVATPEAFPQECATTQLNFAKPSLNLYRLQGEPQFAEQAITHLQQALEIFTFKRFPARYRQCQRNLGLTHFQLGQFQQAHSAFVAAIEADRALINEAYTGFGRRSEVSQIGNVYSQDAYCLLRLGQLGEALVRLEQGKTRLLTESLAMDEVDLLSLPETQRQSIRTVRQSLHELESAARSSPRAAATANAIELAETLHRKREELSETIDAIRAEHPGFMPSGLDLPGLLALAPAGGALVMPMITAKGAAVLVLPHGVTNPTEQDHCVRLDDCTSTDESAWLFGTGEPDAVFEKRTADRQGWVPAYYRRQGDAEVWLEVIEYTGQVLWKKLIEPIHERLVALGLGEGAPVLLITPGGMNLLPLHAAWREVNGVKRYFLDDYTVPYAPSGYALHVSQRRLQESKRQQWSLLAVFNPTADLIFASSEGEAVAAMFKAYPHRSLPAGQATLDAVLRSAPGKTHLHFACHGYYDWQRPMHSGLVLAEKVPLTLSQVFSVMDFSTARLAVLSACETGLTDIGQSPDEFLGLPAGFLEAGAPAVMSTLWAVDDFSTTLLVEGFYARHLNSMSPPAALREAQQAVRDLTAAEVAAHAERAYQAAADEGNKAELLKQSLYYHALAGSNPGLRPFEHPYYWAAFAVNGM